MNKLFVSVLALLFVFAAQVNAQEVTTFTLAEALETALLKNHSIMIAANQAEIDQNNATIGNAGLLPSLSLNGSVNNSIENTTSEFFDGTTQDVDNASSTTRSLSVDANYTLFDGFGNYYNFRSLQNLSEQSGVSARLQIESTLFQVIQLYLNAISARESIRINQEAIERSLDRYQRALNQRDFGVGTSIDLLNAEVDLNSDSVAYYQALTDYSKAKRDLLISLGMESSTQIDITEDLGMNNSLSLDPLLERSFNQNSSLVLAQLGLDNSDFNLKQQRSSRFPVISANGSYGLTSNDFETGQVQSSESDGFSFGLTLSWNLFSGRQQETRIQNALINLKNSEEDLDLIRLSLDRDVRNSYDDYETNIFLLEKEFVNLQTAELNYERSEELFQLGQITNGELRDAQLNISQIELRILSLQIQAKISEIELYQLSGSLIQSDENGDYSVSPELR